VSAPTVPPRNASGGAAEFPAMPTSRAAEHDRLAPAAPVTGDPPRGRHISSGQALRTPPPGDVLVIPPYQGVGLTIDRPRRAALEAERAARRAQRGRGLAGRRLELNALALMFTTAATALLGLAFWAVAARYYSTASVGRGSAMISSLTLMSTLAQLNLGNVFARYLPTAGRSSRRFVLRGYLVVVGFGLVLGAGFAMAGLGRAFFTHPLDRVLFPVYVAVIALFTLQDFVLLSIQAAKYIPVKNVIFSLVKLVLLAMLAAELPDHGIPVAWVLPAVVGAIAVTAAVRLRGLPDPNDPNTPAGELPDRRTMGGVIAGEYVSGAAGVVVPMVLPLLVLWELGAEANAFFSMPWLVASSLSMLIWNVASSLLVEAATDKANAGALVRRALKLSLVVGGAGGLVELAGAPFILAVLGPEYAREGTDLLRVMALVVPFNAVLVAWTTLMRIHGRMALLVTQQVVGGAGTIGLTVLLLPSLGVTGAGVGFVVSQAACGLAVALPLWRMLQAPAGPAGPAGSGATSEAAPASPQAQAPAPVQAPVQATAPAPAPAPVQERPRRGRHVAPGRQPMLTSGTARRESRPGPRRRKEG
jgi:O-antigen/teichoic acid export membrane protein